MSSTSAESGRERGKYRLKVVPNGTRVTPSYPAEEMTWTGAQVKRAPASANEDKRRQDEWTRQTQREIELRAQRDSGGARGKRGGEQGSGRDVEGDWRDAWRAQTKRQVDENPHKQYAFDTKRMRGAGLSTSGRAFAI